MIPFTEIAQRVRVRQEIKQAGKTDDPRHPWNSPQWFAGVDASFPPRVFGRMVGHAAAVLVKEQIASEEWRAQRVVA